ncbi:hypothetical protein GCM10009624_26030 [Gordonia sinesedis]
MNQGPTTSTGDTLAARLNSLIRRHSTEHGTLTNGQLAAALKADDPGLKVSGAYLSALRTGKRTRPSAELQVALARYFDVPVSYLVDPAAGVDGRVPHLDQMDQLGVRSIALRAAGLDQESLSTVVAVLDHVRRLQGLPPVDDTEFVADGDADRIPGDGA